MPAQTLGDYVREIQARDPDCVQPPPPVEPALTLESALRGVLHALDMAERTVRRHKDRGTHQLAFAKQEIRDAEIELRRARVAAGALLMPAARPDNTTAGY